MQLSSETIRTKVRTHLEELLHRTTPGDRLPSEQQLARDLRVSRATVRDVLSQLESEGFVIRRQGSDTFASRLPLEPCENLMYYMHFPTLIERQGHQATFQQLDFRLDPADTFYARNLQIPLGAPVVTRRCIYLADGHFCVLVEDSLPRSLLTDGQYAQLLNSDNIDIRVFLLSNLGRYAYRDEMDISSITAGEFPQLRDLAADPSQPMLRFVSACFDKQNKPLVCAQIFTDTRYVQYRINRHIL